MNRQAAAQQQQQAGASETQRVGTLPNRLRANSELRCKQHDLLPSAAPAEAACASGSHSEQVPNNHHMRAFTDTSVYRATQIRDAVS